MRKRTRKSREVTRLVRSSRVPRRFLLIAFECSFLFRRFFDALQLPIRTGEPEALVLKLQSGGSVAILASVAGGHPP